MFLVVLIVQGTKYGCCDDGQTVAEGPNGEGCVQIASCADMLYGCCSDGLTPANGPDMAGCDQATITLRSPMTAAPSNDDVTEVKQCKFK